jgi:glutamate dehydrogenase (NAD(P)+)
VILNSNEQTGTVAAEDPWPPLKTIVVPDSDGNPLGFLVIHSLVQGLACGGIRMARDVTLAEVAGLAKAMTCKFSFFSIWLGGAKSGIILPPHSSKEERVRRLTLFGKTLSPVIQSTYLPGRDMGIQTEDLRIILEAAGMKPSTAFKDHSGFLAAFGVFSTLRAVAGHLQLPIAKLRIVLEGFGNVGQPLSDQLNSAGAKIVGVSTFNGGIYNPNGLDIDRLKRLAEMHGDDSVKHYHDAEKMDRSEMFQLPADVLIPGARAWSIHKDNAASILAQVVLPAANIPVTLEAEAILQKKGCLIIPDFVSTSGTAIGSGLIYQGYSFHDTLQIMERIYDFHMERLLKTFKAGNLSLIEQAKRIAFKRYSKIQQENRRRQESKMGFIASKLNSNRNLRTVAEKIGSKLYCSLHWRSTPWLKDAAISHACRMLTRYE